VIARRRDWIIESLTPLDVGDVVPIFSVWIDSLGEPLLPLRHRLKRERRSRLLGILRGRRRDDQVK
jgi:hypothetical protein